MNSRLNSLMRRLQNIYKIRGISLDDSYTHEVEQYYNLISTSLKTQALNERDRIFVIAVISEKAAAIARTRRSNVINAGLFREALLEYKGPIRPPDDKCEEAAIKIYRNRKLYESRLSGDVRRFFQAT